MNAQQVRNRLRLNIQLTNLRLSIHLTIFSGTRSKTPLPKIL